MVMAYEAHAQSQWNSRNILIRPFITLVLQTTYNVVVVWGKEVVGVVCVLLWGAVAGNGWLWVACWTVFPNAVWLHVLNAILWLHGILWDAGIWYVSWTHELRFLA